MRPSVQKRLSTPLVGLKRYLCYYRYFNLNARYTYEAHWFSLVFHSISYVVFKQGETCRPVSVRFLNLSLIKINLSAVISWTFIFSKSEVWQYLVDLHDAKTNKNLCLLKVGKLDCLPAWLSGSWPLPIDVILVKRLWISWFLRLRFCGRSRNLEFTITITIGSVVNNKPYGLQLVGKESA